MTDLAQADLQRAVDTIWAFLDALKRDDDDAVADLLDVPFLRQLRRAPQGVAAGFIAAWNIRRDELERLGLVMTARILPGSRGPRGLVAFGLIPGDGPRIVGTAEQATALALTMARGRWRIWGFPDAVAFREATLVRLAPGEEVKDEWLSVMASEWILALEPHLEALVTLREPSVRGGLPSPIERAHTMAAITMLVFVMESLSERLRATGSTSDGVPAVLVDEELRQEATELIVVRNVVAHNHVWRVAVTASDDFSTVEIVGEEQMRGHATALYRAAVDAGASRTRRLNLPVMPMRLSRNDAQVALVAAVRIYDQLAALDSENMRSVADSPVRIADRIIPLRGVILDRRAR